MGVMVLLIVVLPPGLVSLLDLRPGARVGKRMVGKPPLDREQGFRIVLPGFPRIDTFFADTQHVIKLYSDR
jgi:hypothetical protein